jgi:hypothetical protein
VTDGAEETVLVLLREGADDTEKDGVILGAKLGNDDDDDDDTSEGSSDGPLEGSSVDSIDG